MWPGPVTAVEVLTQPAAIRGPRGPTSTRTPAQFGDHLIMFLKLSAKLYTSVFHHGLKVLSLKSSARHELGTQQCRRGKEPLGLRTEGPSQGWCPLPPSLCFLLTPQHWPEQVGKQQSCLYLRQRKQGQAPHSESSPISTLFYLFKIVCVCEPGMVASACNPITQEAEAGKALSKEKKNDFHKAGLSLSVPAPGLSWPPSHVPSSVDILAVFERELSSGGH